MPRSSLRYAEAVRRTLNRPSPFMAAAAAAEGGLKLENLSHGQLQVLSAVPAVNAALAMAGDAETSPWLYVDTPPPITAGRGVVKRLWNGKAHVVPMHADWFCPTKVHSLERQVGPHLFSGKSEDDMTEKYMNFRNLVVAKYMENPETRLLINDCLGMVDGIDYEDSTRIFHFLEHWGIINYCAAVPDQESGNLDSYLWEDENGEFHLPSVLKSSDCLIKFDKPKCRLKADDAYSLSPLSSNGDDISDLEIRIQEKLSEHKCNYCSQPLFLGYYQSVKEDDVMLCLDCYHEGRFVLGHSSMDFSRVDSAKDHEDHRADIWTDQETVLLLEALEMYNDNWLEIADHVGSKSKAQCILHFLRMPMEDGLLSNLDVGISSNGHSAGNCIQDSDSFSSMPFMQIGNPVMALVAFLAPSVGSRVAAACAQASLGALAEDVGLSSSETNLPTDGSIHSNRTLSENGSQDATRNSDQHGDENITAQASQRSNNAEVPPLSTEKMVAAAKVGLVAAAVKAKLLADHEEREIQRQSVNLTSAQMKRIELKLKQYTEIDALLLTQCEQYEKTRQKFAAERAIYMVQRSAPSPLVPNAENTLTSNRPVQQLMSASSSFQPSFSGFSNQMNHPNNMMPFMQQQQQMPAFSFGPHVPSLSSQTPNFMFNAQGSGQSSFGHPMLRPIPGSSSGFS